MTQQNNQRGFTLVEVLTSLAILVLVTALTALTFVNFRNTQALRVATQDVHTALIDARNATLAAKNDSAHGVHIEASQVVRFFGTSYSSTSPDNIYYEFETPVTATTTLTGGVIDITFARLTGEANTSGTIVLNELNTGIVATITIYASGLIEL